VITRERLLELSAWSLAIVTIALTVAILAGWIQID